MEQRTSIGDMLRSLPLAHQVVIAIAAAILAMAGFFFFQWVSTPSMTVLFSDLDDANLATVVDELGRLGVPYEIDGGGSQVLVPKSQVYEVRGQMASAGVRSGADPEGFELLDGQGLNVSDFRQRVDYQRALEGELEKTLLTMDAITSATVHLVLPEETLFAEDEEPVTASVLLSPNRTLGELEVETVTFLVAAAVEGLETKNVTVADVDGHVLHAGGEIAGDSVASTKQLRMTRDFETALAADVQNILAAVVGPNAASVVVRAELDFDETETETQTFDNSDNVTLRDSNMRETYRGIGDPPGGTLGVEGEELATEEGTAYTYERDEVITEYGVDQVITRTITAPGKVEQLSVAVVMDDGSLTGAPVPEMTEVEGLIAAAVGLDTTNGDTLSVTAIPFPAASEDAIEETAADAPATDVMALIPQAIGGLVILLVAGALLLMSRGGKKPKAVPIDATMPALGSGEAARAGSADGTSIAGAVGGGDSSIPPDVLTLVQRQPEEIAVLLRGWLADRR
jgi:flagellar M-ring protein FliF